MIDDIPEASKAFVFEQAHGDARTEIEQHVKALGPYEFQNLVAAHLRSMTYATQFVAPTEPDGGTDILAYPDPPGAQTPQSQKATREEIAALRGINTSSQTGAIYIKMQQ